jgi:hypothetical protein
MRAPDGEEFLNVGSVHGADPPERLVFTIALLNADGIRGNARRLVGEPRTARRARNEGDRPMR